MGHDKRLAGAATRRVTVLLASAMTATALSAGVALAGGGGTAAPGDPQLDDVECLTLCVKQRIATEGSRIKIVGSDLANTTVVKLVTGEGTFAKQSTKKGVVVKGNGRAVWADVEPGVVTGEIRVIDSFGQVRDSKFDLKIGSEAQLRKAQAGFIFPVRGAHEYWDGFGAGRGHEGQDVGAACGTKLVAAHGGKVQYRGYQGAAGNYIVIDGRQFNDYAYMHLKKPASVREGQTVYTGQKVGVVGQTGDASGCHLHFELWTEPGWYEGGHAIPPTKTLKYWDSFS